MLVASNFLKRILFTISLLSLGELRILIVGKNSQTATFCQQNPPLNVILATFKEEVADSIFRMAPLTVWAPYLLNYILYSPIP